MHKLFKYLFFSATAVELTRNIFDWDFEHYSKPLIVLFLFLYFITANSKKDTAFWLVAISLVFSWLGDSFLMYQELDATYFILGLVSFLIAHVLYAISYFKLRWAEAENPLLPTQKLRHSITLVLAGVALVAILSPNLGDMRLPVTVYAAVLVFMAISALLRYGYTPIKSFGLVFGGAIFFMISDSLLAINKFMESFAYSGFWVMLTYSIAQYLIIEGVIRHQRQG
ncbi:lysoplasmalogenase [Fulvivirga lutea]|uniref:Lysoplasmalogenase n=1 Tax=Fulvivirga lutea TaxID=2810512 RepID=A0A975A0S6_9BACT|nr:lysoplasmalogenase [Fulvivirga lutea]QSE97704.1 lysoplasmalogenase [Fulvivirga lutea]